MNFNLTFDLSFYKLSVKFILFFSLFTIFIIEHDPLTTYLYGSIFLCKKKC